jgi:hypothetical protein
MRGIDGSVQVARWTWPERNALAYDAAASVVRMALIASRTEWMTWG